MASEPGEVAESVCMLAVSTGGAEEEVVRALGADAVALLAGPGRVPLPGVDHRAGQAVG